MSKASRKKQSSRSDSDASAGGKRAAIEFKPPLPPSRKMFFVATGLLAVWLGVLLTLYVAAILPEKQKKQSDAPHAPATLPGTVAR